MENRTCKDCSIDFPLNETFFYRNKLNCGGLDIRCKKCRKIYSRKWELVNKNKIPKNLDVPDGFKKCPKCVQILPKTQEYFKLEKGKYFWGSCNGCRNESRKTRDKEYYEKTRDKQAEVRKSYRNANKDVQAEWHRNYYKTPHRRFSHCMNSAKQRFIPFDLTMEEFMTFWEKLCYYCDGEVGLVGLDRLDPSKGYEMDNVVSCCKHCNFAKHLFNEKDFISHCEKIVNNFKSKRLLRVV